MAFLQDPPERKYIKDPFTPDVSVLRAVEITEDVNEEKFDVYLYYARTGDRADGEVLVQLFEARASPRKSTLYKLSIFREFTVPPDLRTFLKPVGYDPELIVSLIWEWALE